GLARGSSAGDDTRRTGGRFVDPPAEPDGDATGGQGVPQLTRRPPGGGRAGDRIVGVGDEGHTGGVARRRVGGGPPAGTCQPGRGPRAPEKRPSVHGMFALSWLPPFDVLPQSRRFMCQGEPPPGTLTAGCSRVNKPHACAIDTVPRFRSTSDVTR